MSRKTRPRGASEPARLDSTVAKKKLPAGRPKARRRILRTAASDFVLAEEENGEQLLASDAPMGYNPVYDAPPFTAFASVTPSTCLKTLNLNWRERDLPERVKTWHVYGLHAGQYRVQPARGRREVS